MVALLLMGSISMYGQTTSKMTLSGRVKGFTDTPTLICDLSMEHVKPGHPAYSSGWNILTGNRNPWCEECVL